MNQKLGLITFLSSSSSSSARWTTASIEASLVIKGMSVCPSPTTLAFLSMKKELRELLHSRIHLLDYFFPGKKQLIPYNIMQKKKRCNSGKKDKNATAEIRNATLLRTTST